MPRGFGFVHLSIAILYHQVPNPNLTIRNSLIAVGCPVQHDAEPAVAAARRAALDRLPVEDKTTTALQLASELTAALDQARFRRGRLPPTV